MLGAKRIKQTTQTAMVRMCKSTVGIVEFNAVKAEFPAPGMSAVAQPLPNDWYSLTGILLE